MDRRERPPREDRYRHQRENPSFSSTLLDSIYRSIDESNDKGEEEVILCRENMRKKLGNALKEDRRREEMESLQRAYMIEKWMEKKVTYENVAVRRKLTADFNKKPFKNLDSVLLNSSSSSSDSSSGGVFSSSESEPIYALNSRSSPTRFMQRPKPIRTSISTRPGRHQRPLCEMDMYHHHEGHHLAGRQEPKHEGGFIKTRSRALKIYRDLKKVKQPISPGGRLASFLNSLFTTGQAKKAKISPSGYEESKLKSEQASTCSSASSFSRSCLSKTPSSRSKLSNGTKRSVRFYPVSVIVDEDSRPCGHKSLYESEESLITVTAPRSSSNEELKIHVMNENRRVEEIARDFLKNYQNEKKGLDMRDFCSGIEGSITDEGDENDAASYSSSDLFELDNLSAVGIERYREELPVYETTHLDTNRAIVNGLIL